MFFEIFSIFLQIIQHIRP